MNTYHPDSWKIVVIDSAKHGKVYKVLASWYGGFVQGDSWKLSSGIESVSYENGIYTMPQSSGSVYMLHENCEHISGIMGGVFSSFAKQAEESEGAFTITMLEMADLLEAFKV
jgi:hypothetical protein